LRKDKQAAAMMKKKKLAIFVNSMGRGGAEKVVWLLSKLLCHDVDIHLLVFDKKAIEFELPPSVKIVQVGRYNNPLRAALLFNIFLYAPLVKRYLKANDIPVLLSFLSRPALTAGVVKWLGWRGSWVICERTMTSAYYFRSSLADRTVRFLVKRLYKKANLIITNSQLNQQDLRTSFGLGNPITTIYNPVDIAEAMTQQPAVGPPKATDAPFVFCNVGRCDYYKNQTLLLRAFAKMHNRHCRLQIIGKDVPQQLRPLCQQLGLTDRVQLLDLQLDIYPHLWAADAFVLSSVIEGFPNVLLEALACSLPIVSTDCKSGPREILAPGTAYPTQFTAVEEAAFGLLCANNDADMLAAAMDKLANSPALARQYAQKALQRAQQFDLATFERAFRDALAPFYPS
jgi:N-acetylgalactosamine-N,N'-diacetylbacillosaminyl-diphospho-undecaprenol 4-alpha-N-acetylgalactosaminyltransferase